jgi:hypothetical protein
MEQKKWYLSKTVWMQALGLVMVILPQTQAFIKENFMEAGVAWAAINLVLRYVTKGSIQIL